MIKKLINRLEEEFETINMDNNNNDLIIKSPFDRTIIKVKIIIENIKKIKIEIFKEDNTKVQTAFIEDSFREGYNQFNQADYENCILYIISSYFINIYEGITILDVHSS